MIWIQLKYKVKNKIRYLQSITIQKRPSISFINFHQKYKNIYRFTNFSSTIYRLFIIFNTIQLFLISRLRTLLFKNLHLNKEHRPLSWPALLFLYSSLRMTFPLQFAGAFFFASAGIVRFGIADGEKRWGNLPLLYHSPKYPLV